MIIRIICSNADCGYHRNINLEDEDEEETVEDFLLCPICDSVLVLPKRYFKE